MINCVAFGVNAMILNWIRLCVLCVCVCSIISADDWPAIGTAYVCFVLLATAAINGRLKTDSRPKNTHAHTQNNNNSNDINRRKMRKA